MKAARSSQLFSATVCLSILGASSAAQSIKLNRPLALETGGRVDDVGTSPDGAWVVYEAPADAEMPGLFSVPVDGSESARVLVPPGVERRGRDIADDRVVFGDLRDLYVVAIEGGRSPVPLLPVDPERNLDRFRFVPGGGRVVYMASQSGAWHLFSITSGGDGVPVALGGPVPASLDFQLSPDGSRVVYVTSGPAGHELFSVPVDGSSGPVKLNGPLVAGGNVLHGTFSSAPVRISPNGERVVYMADQDVDEVVELYSVPIDGSAAPVKLNGLLVAGGDVREHALTPDGHAVVYVADQQVDEREDLYMVPLEGGAAPTKINAALGDVTIFAIGPGGHHVVYRAGGFSVRRWFAASLVGAPAPFELPVQPIGPIEFDASGTHIAYLGNRNARIDVFSVELERAESLNLSRTTGSRSATAVQVAADGSVFYLELAAGSSLVRRVPVVGGEATVHAGPFPTWANAQWIGPAGALRIAPDGLDILLVIDLEIDEVHELFSLPVAAPRPPIRLSAPFAAESSLSDVESFEIAHDGSAAAFTVRTGYDPAGVQLFAVPLDPRGRPRELFVAEHRIVGQYALLPDAGRVVFEAGNPDQERFDLYSVPLVGGLAPVQLNDPTTSASGVASFATSPDEEWVVFESMQGDGSELYAVDVDGGPEIELSGELVEEGTIGSFQVTSDSSRVVYSASQFTAGQDELFSVPIDGSLPPVRLSQALVSAGDVHSFRITPDDSRVVYRADVTTDGVVELFAVPADGSAVPVRLSGALVAASAVAEDFAIAPDGARVVFRADRTVDERFELFVAPIDGSSAPVPIGGALPDGGDVVRFAIAPGGAAVVYRADQAQDEVFELFAAPLDGSAVPVRISGALAAGGDVQPESPFALAPAFRIAPDGSTVVYRADRRADELFELFSARIDGSGTPVLLSGLLVAGGDVLDDIEITPDGKHVVYCADQITDHVFELFVAPIDRPKESRRLVGPLVGGGDVILRHGSHAGLEPFFAIAPGGDHVLYLADQDTLDAFELYTSPTVRRGRTPLQPGETLAPR